MYKKPKSKFRFGIILLSLLFSLFFIPARVEAVIIDNDGQINAGETINDDVFLSGRTIVVDGTINGALFASGESININGIINGDLFVSGRTITLSDKSAVGGNLFAAGQNLVINGKVNGSVFIGGATADFGPSANVMRNIFYGGYSLNVAQGARTGRDMMVGAYQAIIKGDIAKDLKVGANALEVNGKVGGDIVVNIGGDISSNAQMPSFLGKTIGLPDPIQPGLRIGNDAKISGKISYTAPQDLRENIKSQPAGGILFKTPEPQQGKQKNQSQTSPVMGVLNWFFDRIRLLITLLVIGGLVVWLTPNVLRMAEKNIKTEPVKVIWKGLLTVFGGYLLLGLAFVVLIILVILLGSITLNDLSTIILGVGTSGLGVLATTFGLTVGFISKIIVAFLVGNLIFMKIFPNRAGNIIIPMIIGIVIYVFIRSIPIVGWLVGAAVTLAGMGALWALYESKRKSPPGIVQDSSQV